MGYNLLVIFISLTFTFAMDLISEAVIRKFSIHQNYYIWCTKLITLSWKKYIGRANLSPDIVKTMCLDYEASDGCWHFLSHGYISPIFIFFVFSNDCVCICNCVYSYVYSCDIQSFSDFYSHRPNMRAFCAHFVSLCFWLSLPLPLLQTSAITPLYCCYLAVTFLF